MVFLEVITFGAGLVVFVAQGRAHAGEFVDGQALLNLPIALANTLILLTGGWCMVNSITALRGGQGTPASRWLLAAIGSATGFILVAAGVKAGLIAWPFMDLRSAHPVWKLDFFALLSPTGSCVVA